LAVPSDRSRPAWCGQILLVVSRSFHWNSKIEWILASVRNATRRWVPANMRAAWQASVVKRSRRRAVPSGQPYSEPEAQPYSVTRMGLVVSPWLSAMALVPRTKPTMAATLWE